MIYIQLKTIYSIFLGSSLWMVYACGTSKSNLFRKQTAHEKYSASLESAGLQQTLLGRSWIAAAEKSLQTPFTVALPYQEKGYFPAETPSATGLRFAAKRGEQLVITLSLQPMTKVFVEIWMQEKDTQKLMVAADSIPREWTYEVEKDGFYQLRLQPELLQSISYMLRISTAPSLQFPVNAVHQPNVSSFWGADRDKGSRRHEGVDIFAKKGTPALAAADGVVSNVSENNLGGKVVFFQPRDKNYTLYYAHLDSQWVQKGQSLRAGDSIGAIGNTGNARSTQPHLHFGIYSSGGAIDPFPFIQTNRPSPFPLTADTSAINSLRSTNAAKVFYPDLLPQTSTQSIEKGTLTTLLSVTNNGYRVKLPNGQQGFIKATHLSHQHLRWQTLVDSSLLLDRPDTNGAIVRYLPIGKRVSVEGMWNDFLYVADGTTRGWVYHKR